LFEPIVEDLKENIGALFDLKAMCVNILQDDLDLLVEMFQQLGRREFKFIEHFSAVMGFFLGVLQLGIYQATKDWPPWASFMVLPCSGLVIGYFTNWAGINLIFRPVHPHYFCGGYVNFQGVFLKRQYQVAGELATLTCQQMIYTRNIIKFVVESPEYYKVVDMYRRYTFQAIEQSVGAARHLFPAVGLKDKFEEIKDDVVELFLDELRKDTIAEELSTYTDRVFDIENTMRDRLRLLPPDEFEGMLHPVFQEDEWMVLLLGAVLGVAVGTFQSWTLGA